MLPNWMWQKQHSIMHTKDDSSIKSEQECWYLQYTYTYKIVYNRYKICTNGAKSLWHCVGSESEVSSSPYAPPHHHMFLLYTYSVYTGSHSVYSLCMCLKHIYIHRCSPSCQTKYYTVGLEAIARPIWLITYMRQKPVYTHFGDEQS